jgi:hypothetical protein
VAQGFHGTRLPKNGTCSGVDSGFWSGDFGLPSQVRVGLAATSSVWLFGLAWAGYLGDYLGELI